MKQRLAGLLVAGLLLLGGVPSAMAIQIEKKNPDGTETSWGLVTSTTIVSGVTTNTTSTVGVRAPAGNKTFWMEVRGTGAVTATVTIYGARVANAVAAEMVALNTPTALSGTTVAVDAAATSTAPYPYYYVKTENVTGTGAAVLVEVFY